MRPAPDPTDWSVLSQLLRLAQRAGWQVAFQGGCVEIAPVWVEPGITALPARLLREARQAGWQVGRGEPARGLVLRHPAVREPVRLLTER